jgi:hypothetical protein
MDFESTHKISHFLPSMFATIANNFGFSLCRGWMLVGVEGEYRHVNDILGILLKEHFPGMVTLPGEGKVPESARTWDHYKACEDLGVANNIEFHNKAERDFAELWVIIKFPSHTAYI